MQLNADLPNILGSNLQQPGANARTPNSSRVSSPTASTRSLSGVANAAQPAMTTVQSQPPLSAVASTATLTTLANSEALPNPNARNAVHMEGGIDDASFEELAASIMKRITDDRESAAGQMLSVETAERALAETQLKLEETERRIFSMVDGTDDVVDLNVGGQLVSTTRSVLCSAEGSLLAGMFSGNFDDRLKRDKDGRIFMDVDSSLFNRILLHLRMRRIASPDCPAPLPCVSEEMRPEYDMMVKYFGLETFMYGLGGRTGNIFQRLAELAGVSQSKLQTHEVIRIILSSSGGVPANNHEEVLGPVGFHERSLENSYGAHPNTITIKFLKHRVLVEGLELRAKVADVTAHMSNQWTFRHGGETVSMNYSFTRSEPSSGRMEVNFGGLFADEVQWTFPRDFCLEHIVLHGRFMPA